jgi:hypothetical protein
MGDYREMVFNNLKNKRIGIDMIIGENGSREKYTLESDWICDKRAMMPKLQHVRVQTPPMQYEVSATKGTSYNLKLDYDPKKYLKQRSVRKIIKVLNTLFESIKSEVPSKKQIKGIRLDLLSPYKIKQRRFDSLEKIHERLPVVHIIPNFLSSINANINFISSFRLQPERTYYQKSRSGEKIEKYGENYIDQIVEWEKQKSKKFKELNLILKDFNLLYSLKSKQLPGGRFELRVKVGNRGIWALLSDVGFGISQFLPIIVADLQLSPGSSLFLAQPEIHLHPSVQASLADYFVKQVSKKQKRYIVETHSEYLLNRIRLDIVQGKLQPSDVSVYYFENSPAGTKTYEIIFTKNGQIKKAPKSFFNTYMMDVMDIAMNAR